LKLSDNEGYAKAEPVDAAVLVVISRREMARACTALHQMRLTRSNRY